MAHGSGSGAPIKIGYTIWDQTGFTAVTGNTSNVGDAAANQSADEREMAALVKYANATGGVGGRKILPPIGYKISSEDVADQQTLDTVCARATEDDHVTAYIDRTFLVRDESVACFGKHKTTLISTLVGTGETFFARYRPYLITSEPSVERGAQAYVEGLSAAKWYAGTIGVLLDDSPAANSTYNKIILPYLTTHGIKVKAVVRVNANDPSAQSSQASSAILKFRSSGVDHVMFFAGFFALLGFTNAADSQGYYPRYGWPDYQSTVANAGFYVSPSQAKNSIAVSAGTGYILDPGDDHKQRSLSDDVDRKRASPGLRRCYDAISKYTGIDYYKGSSGRSTEVGFYCEHFFLWLDAARNVGASMTPSNLGAGVAALKSSYPPVLVHSTTFAATRFAGADSYRVGVYSSTASCKCFTAITPWRAF